MHLVENICIEGYYEFDVLGSQAHSDCVNRYVVSGGYLRMPFFYAFFKSQRPQTRPFVLHLQSTVDKLSPYYVLTLNVSTVNLGRVNMNFGSFLGCLA